MKTFFFFLENTSFGDGNFHTNLHDNIALIVSAIAARDKLRDENLANDIAYISTISSAKSVIQGCIEKEFHTLSIEILKCCDKIFFQIEKASFRKIVHFHKLAEK